MNQAPSIGNRGVVVLAIASAIVTANAYYIHPIIGRVADSFGVSAAQVGAVPALNQLALAVGVLLLLPLGDRVSNRRLVLLCLGIQVLSLVAMAFVRDFHLFVAASTTLGFFTITPYLLPAYTSKRVDPARLGFVTAVLTTGVVAGVQLSRLGSGVVGEYLGWRSVYLIAAALMAAAMLVLPLLMDEEPVDRSDQAERYPALLKSLVTLAVSNGNVMLSGLIQGLSFSIFLATWLGIGLYLTGSELGLGTDVVGYLSACSVVALFTTPRLGRWADHRGAEAARLRMALLQFAAVASLALAFVDWRLLLINVLVTAVSGPLIDVTGRMTSLNQPPRVRTRLMSLYITLMFLGAGLGSWAGTAAYDLAGWWGTVLLTVSLSTGVCLLSALACRKRKRPPDPTAAARNAGA
jgi:predicted MFS family arabinose efflux permease